MPEEMNNAGTAAPKEQNNKNRGNYYRNNRNRNNYRGEHPHNQNNQNRQGDKAAAVNGPQNEQQPVREQKKDQNNQNQNRNISKIFINGIRVRRTKS